MGAGLAFEVTAGNGNLMSPPWRRCLLCRAGPAESTGGHARAQISGAALRRYWTGLRISGRSRRLRRARLPARPARRLALPVGQSPILRSSAQSTPHRVLDGGSELLVARDGVGAPAVGERLPRRPAALVRLVIMQHACAIRPTEPYGPSPEIARMDVILFQPLPMVARASEMNEPPPLARNSFI